MSAFRPLPKAVPAARKRPPWRRRLFGGLLICLSIAAIGGAGCRQELSPRWRRAACACLIALPLPTPITAWAYNGRGLAAYEVQDFAAAKADFEASLARAPDQARVYNNLANVHRAKSELALAVQAYGSAIRLAPQTGRYRLNRGMIHLVTGRLSAARDDVEAAVRLQPGAASPLTVRGTINLLGGDIDAAIADYSAAITYAPKFAAPWSNRGCARAMRQDWEGANADFRRAEQLALTARDGQVTDAARFNQAALATRPTAIARVDYKVHEVTYQTVSCAPALPHPGDAGLARPSAGKDALPAARGNSDRRPEPSVGAVVSTRP